MYWSASLRSCVRHCVTTDSEQGYLYKSRARWSALRFVPASLGQAVSSAFRHAPAAAQLLPRIQHILAGVRRFSCVAGCQSATKAHPRQKNATPGMKWLHTFMRSYGSWNTPARVPLNKHASAYTRRATGGQHMYPEVCTAHSSAGHIGIEHAGQTCESARGICTGPS